MKPRCRPRDRLQPEQDLTRTPSKARPRRDSLAGRTDAALVKACLDGQDAAWGEVVNRYGRLVYSIPKRYGLSDADADDVFQTVFTILFRKLDQLREASRLTAWLIRTTHRECYRMGKKSGRYADLDRVIEHVTEPTQDDAEAWETRHLVRQALRQLGGRCEELLTALFLAPGTPSYEVIAQQMDMKVGAIGPTRARCFQKMEKILLELGLPAEDRPRSSGKAYQPPA